MYCRPFKRKKDNTEFIELVIDISYIPENNTINREIILRLKKCFYLNSLAVKKGFYAEKNFLKTK